MRLIARPEGLLWCGVASRRIFCCCLCGGWTVFFTANFLLLFSFRLFGMVLCAFTVLTDLQLPPGVRGQDAAVRLVGEVSQWP